MNRKLIVSIVFAAAVLGMLAFAPASKAEEVDDCKADCAAQYEDCVQQCDEDKDCALQCQQNQSDCESACESS